MIKIERNPVPPPSLAVEAKKANGVYNKPDVVQQLKKDSNDKCYICELGGLSDPEVEHLRPHHGRKIPERVFDWNNLFYACPHCNNLKKEAKYDDKIIDCCMEDPENMIEQCYENGQVKVRNIVADDRGVHSPSAVKEEQKIAERFQNNAEYLSLNRYPKTAKIYYDLARSFFHKSAVEREDAENGRF